MNAEPHKYTVREFLRLVKIAPDRPDKESLERLMRAFGRFPYENFTKIIMDARHKDVEDKLRLPDVVLADHMDLGAGGTCFSLTNFFEAVLTHIGFDVYPVLCDRSYGANTHCALIAKLAKNKYLVDPGYLMNSPIPVPKRGGSFRRLPSSTVKLSRLGETSQLILATLRNGSSNVRYRLKDVPVSRETFVEQWKDSFGWTMMRHPCASKMTDEGQVFMRDGVLRKSDRDRSVQSVIRRCFEDDVAREFGISKNVVEEALSCLKEKRTRL